MPETPSTPTPESAQPQRSRLTEVRAAVSQRAEGMRNRISTWLGRNNQAIPQEDPAGVLEVIANGQTETSNSHVISSTQPATEAAPKSALRERLDSFGKKIETHLDGDAKVVQERERAAEADLPQLEAKLGIETDADRVLEASLFVDKKFVDVAVITGQQVDVEKMFGNTTYAGWLEARSLAKTYGNADLTPEFLVQLHDALMKRSKPDVAGNIRDHSGIGAAYEVEGEKITLTDEQIQNVRDNPYLAYRYEGNDPHVGWIAYPTSDNPKQLLEGMTSELCQWYNEQKNAGMDPHELAANLQRRLVSIHPFPDGTGTLSRLAMNWSLENNGVSPSVLEDPNDDILVSPEVWVQKVKEGSERYKEIEARKAEMQEAGIDDKAELMGLDKERTFYDYIYSRLNTPPRIGARPKLSHQAYQSFKDGLSAEMKQFEDEYTATSGIITAKNQKSLYGDPNYRVWDQSLTEVHQGGLIGKSYMDVLTRKPNPNLDAYMQKHMFQDVEIFRGGRSNRTIDDQELCGMFTDFVGVGSGYRMLTDGHTSANAVDTIPKHIAKKSLEDHNRILTLSYLNEHHRAKLLTGESLDLIKREKQFGVDLKRIIKSFRDNNYFNERVTHHSFQFMDDILGSPYASASFSKDTARGFAKNESGNEAMKIGLLFESKVPNGGAVLGHSLKVEHIGGASTPGEVSTSEIKAVSGKVHGYYQSELYIPAGIDPRSITAITMDRFPDQKGLYGPIQKRAERVFKDGQEYIEITTDNLNTWEQPSKQTYIFNSNIGRFQPYNAQETSEEQAA